MTTSPLIGISVGMRPDSEHEIEYLSLLPTYPHAVALAGGLPTLIPLGIDADTLRRLYERLDGVILSGGGDLDPTCYGADQVSPFTRRIQPERDDVELQLARWAVEDSKPILGICRGIQVLNVALGGTLIQDIREEVPGALRHDAPSPSWFFRPLHTVTVEPGSHLAASLGANGQPLEVNSLHHQSLKDLAPGLTVVARAPDGVVEGVEMAGQRFTLGVQWHPEGLAPTREPHRRLFEALVQAAGS